MIVAQEKNTDNKKLVHMIFLIIGAALVAGGVISGMIRDGGVDFGTLRYFTYLSNIVLIVSFMFLALAYDHKYRDYVCFAATLAIVVTGLVYNFILVPISGNAPIWHDFTNFIIHFTAMVWAVINYLAFETKGKLKLKHLIIGMVFPFVYWVVFIIVGYADPGHFYPYFFMDTQKNNFFILVLWLLALLFVFTLIGLLTLFFDKKRGERNENLHLNTSTKQNNSAV